MYDLGKQVPVQKILDKARREVDATAIGLSALLVSTSKQMPIIVSELHRLALEYPVLIGGAAINRNFGAAPRSWTARSSIRRASTTARTRSKARR